MVIGLVGSGNMATALARGWGEPVLLHRRRRGARAGASPRRRAARRWRSNAELADRAEVVMLCHKPYQLDEVAEQIGGRAKASRRSLRCDGRRARVRLPGHAGDAG
jgi:pyrroline-5-carboxylate reductase